MSDDTISDGDRYLLCRRFIFREGSPGQGEPEVVPAEMCKTPVGVISSLDCPVWLGHECRFFEEREGDPEPLISAEIEDLRDKLRRDYLRWRYRRRTRELHAATEVVAPVLLDDDEGTEIPARPEAAAGPGQRQPRFPGDAPSGPAPIPPEAVDLDNLPDILPSDVLPEDSTEEE